MKRETRARRKLRAVIGGVVVSALSIVGLATLAPSASAAPYCGPSKFVEKIEVVKWGPDNRGVPQFQIVLTPTGKAREHAAFARNKREAVVQQWHAIQRCVAGLYGSRADTIWDQLECHQLNSWITLPREGSIWATGSAYELETWRPTLPRWVSGRALILTECLNRLGTDPAGPFTSPFRPDTRQVDLSRTW